MLRTRPPQTNRVQTLNIAVGHHCLAEKPSPMPLGVVGGEFEVDGGCIDLNDIGSYATGSAVRSKT